MARIPLKRLEPGLAADWYYDPVQYERELAAAWYRGWVAVAREEELPRPGDWKTATVGDQSLVIVRGERIRAFHNTCRHRGSVLCTAPSGRFERGRIACPYHAWTYDLEGRLVATPRRMETPDFEPSRFGLFEAAVGCWGGFVFVRLEGKADFDAFIGPLADRLQAYDLGGLRIGRRIVADVQANWKLLAENFSECFHCPPVHPELCRIVPAYREAGAWGLRGAEARTGATPEYARGAATLTLDGTARLPPFRGLDEAARRTLYVPEMLLPNLFLNLHPDYVNSHMMFPTGPQSVRIVYDWLFEADRLPLEEAVLEHYVALWDLTNRQDARNCEWQQQGMRSRAFRHGWYVPQEFDCHRFAQWLRGRLSPRAGRTGSGGPSARARSRKARRS